MNGSPSSAAPEDANHLLPLKEWVSLSKQAQEQQSSSPETIRNAQLDYIAHAVVVAALILDKLLVLEETHNNGYLHDVSVEDIHVVMESDVNTLRQMRMTDPQQLISGLQSVQGVKLSNSQHQTNNSQGVSIFKRAGLILYSIFTRGEAPPCEEELEDTNSANDEEVTSNNNDTAKKRSTTHPEHFESYEEQPGANKGRQKVASVQEATKSLRRMSFSSLENILCQNSVPPSICTLIVDLIIPPKEDENFHSMSEVVAEIQQIMRRSEFFFGRDPDGNTNSTITDASSLHFGSDIIGRATEVEMLLTASARAQIDTDSSHICLIGGTAGMGKSYLVNSVKSALTNSGWIYLSCKFDRLLRNQPFVTIASAIEQFIQQLIEGRGLPEGFDVDAVVVSIEQNLSAWGIVVLGELVPSLRLLYRSIFARVVMDDDSDDEVDHIEVEATSEDGNDDEDVMYEDGISNANTLRNRLHYLFGRLVGAISSTEHPMLLFLDDLQWADSSSLELVSSLLISGDHDDDNAQCLLVVGAFRSNEVDEAHVLRRHIEKFEVSASVNVTCIHLDGVTKLATHIMISEALLLPLRLTRGLADAVHAKSLGNPLFVQSLLRQLVDDNILAYSLIKNRWVWDIRDVNSVSVDDDVAELMKYKLLRLSSEIQDALKFISCFGIQVSNDIISKFCSSSGNSYDAITASLEHAVGENILTHKDQVYKFAHDTVHQAAYDLMSPEEKGDHHFSIGLRLMSSVSERATFDALIFTVVDQINNAKRYGVTDASINIACAKLNLQAGRRSMEVSDSVSAWQYVAHGIAFLPEAKWESSTYDLSLDLYEAGALACFVNADVENLQMSLEAIFENAFEFEDKIKAYYIMAQNLTSLNRFKEAMATVRFVLNELGESIPEEVSSEDIETAMKSTEQLLDGLSKEDIVGLPRLKDEKKRWALKLIHFFTTAAYMSSRRLLPVLANRIISISLKHGVCTETAFGLSTYSLSLITIRHDIEAGYSHCKLSLALMESFDAPGSLHRLKFMIQNFVNFLVEPIQSTRSVLLESYEGLRAAGDNESACLALTVYCPHQTIASGCSLTVAEKECEEFSLRSFRLNQLQYCRNLSIAHNLVLALIGNTEGKNPFGLLEGHGITSEDDLLEENLSSGRNALSQTIYYNRMIAAFWLKKYVEAAEFAALFRNTNRVSMRPQEIYHSFYEGLTAFHLARSSEDESIKLKWLGVGEKSVARFKMLQEHSTWNFENKYFLLQAECHRCRGEIDDADSKYLAATESARSHRFVHEEGLAMEFYASFLAEIGESDKSNTWRLLAIECYEKWGASAVLNLLKTES